MDNIKFLLGLILNFILIIIFTSIAYHVRDDSLALALFLILSIFGITSFVGKIRHRRFLKELNKREKLNFAKINFNQWYINNHDKKGEKHQVGQRILTPYEMFREVIRDSFIGKKVLELVKEEIEKGGSTKDVFKPKY